MQEFPSDAEFAVLQAVHGRLEHCCADTHDIHYLFGSDGNFPGSYIKNLGYADAQTLKNALDRANLRGITIPQQTCASVEACPGVLIALTQGITVQSPNLDASLRQLHLRASDGTWRGPKVRPRSHRADYVARKRQQKLDRLERVLA
jgi:hypothetical protein